ncbi:MAG: hypothetical protein J7L14_01730 [Candidatus Diapherotrites archaeon]|nr:hypothetical protein [Candidatus Diapherotrites archaeon]
MNPLQRFCPMCGKKTEKFVDKICVECFIKKASIVELPEHLELQRCRKCKKIKFANSWLPFDNTLIKSIVEKHLKINENFEIKDIDVAFDEEKITVKLHGFIAGKPVKVEKNILLKYKEVLCENCYKMQSGYYEAIIQLRTESGKKKGKKAIERLERIFHEIKKFLKKESSEIVAVEKLKEGINLRIFSLRTAKRIAEFLEQKKNAKIIRSSSVVGTTKKGKPRKRITFCARL